MPSLNGGADAGRQWAQHQMAELDASCERIRLPMGHHHMVWRRVGSGPPIALLHGGHGSWLHWARVIPALSRHFTLWVPDMPGYGETTLTPAHGLDELLRWLAHGLDGLVGTTAPVSLLGFSFGGLVAAKLAVMRGHTDRLALIGPAGHGGVRRARHALRPWRGLDPDANADQWLETMRFNLAAHMLHNASAVDALAIEIQWQGCLHTRFHSKPFSRSSELRVALGRFNGPILELWGEHDVTGAPHLMCAERPFVRRHHHRVTVENAGHWLMHEAPSETTHGLMNWLQST